MPEETKIWFKSKGMWAGILTVLFGIYAVVQANFPQLRLFDITGILPIIFTVLGVFGIYGRKDASGKIVFSDQSSN